MNKQKQTYLSPETETLVVRFEGVICGSQDGDVPSSGFGGNPNADVDDQSGSNWWN